MAKRIQLRRDTSTNWTNINPVLSEGEPALEVDTGKMKIGDGTSNWSDLPYFAGSGGSGSPSGNDQYVQYNKNGSFGGNSNFTWDYTNSKLTVNGTIITNSIDTKSITSSGGNLIIIANSSIGIGTNTPSQQFTVSYNTLFNTNIMTNVIYQSLAGNATIDLTKSNKYILTVTDSTTITFNNPSNASVITMIIKNQAPQNSTLQWPSAIKWQNGIAYQLTSDAIDIVTLIFDGYDMYGTYSTNFQ